MNWKEGVVWDVMPRRCSAGDLSGGTATVRCKACGEVITVHDELVDPCKHAHDFDGEYVHFTTEGT